jgi:hypothetical protein
MQDYVVLVSEFVRIPLARVMRDTCDERVQAQSPPASATGHSVPVTVENFIRAETDKYLAMFTKQGGFGKFLHRLA